MLFVINATAAPTSRDEQAYEARNSDGLLIWLDLLCSLADPGGIRDKCPPQGLNF